MLNAEGLKEENKDNYLYVSLVYFYVFAFFFLSSMAAWGMYTFIPMSLSDYLDNFSSSSGLEEKFVLFVLFVLIVPYAILFLLCFAVQILSNITSLVSFVFCALLLGVILQMCFMYLGDVSIWDYLFFFCGGFLFLCLAVLFLKSSLGNLDTLYAFITGVIVSLFACDYLNFSILGLPEPLANTTANVLIVFFYFFIGLGVAFWSSNAVRIYVEYAFDRKHAQKSALLGMFYVFECLYGRMIKSSIRGAFRHMKIYSKDRFS